jgi:hypothetical protein
MNLILSVFLVLIQSSAPLNQDNWLHPNDVAYEKALKEGFSGSAKPGPYNEDKDGIHQVWVDFKTTREGRNQILFFAPLRCAQLLGLNAHDKLLDIPATDNVRRICDGNLYADVTYMSGTHADSFPIRIEHDGVAARPVDSQFTTEPEVSVYHSSSHFTDYTYSYEQQFFFKMPDAWTDSIHLAYVVPESGVVMNVPLDLSVFAHDESTYRAGIR